MPGSANGVVVSGSHAYVVDSECCLDVIDISTPSSPQRVGSVRTPGYPYGVAVSGSRAYVADYSGLQVIDISNPASPKLLGGVVTTGTASGVAVAGSYVWVAAGSHGLVAFRAQCK